MIELILGGARSGKSRFAEQRISELAKSFTETGAKTSAENNTKFTYIATGQAHDGEMTTRIKKHQADRANSDLHWQLIEEPIYLGRALSNAFTDGNESTQSQISHYILVDCLTLWVTNCLCATITQESSAGSQTVNTTVLQQQKAELLAALTKLKKQKNNVIVLVSNEVGHGIVPMGQLSREFVDQSGWLHQEISQLATKVDFIMAGLPLNLKDEN